ncbi:MAG: ATP-binding protein [Thermoguttaceae bacterium]|nr:ATP-binding protein [Thermoguttaceae bacterium]
MNAPTIAADSLGAIQEIGNNTFTTQTPTPLSSTPSDATAPRCAKCDDSGFYVDENGFRFLCPCRRADLAETRRKYSGLPEFVRRPLRSSTRDYVRRYEEIAASGKNWILYCGKTGSGKSTQAFEILDELLKRPGAIFARAFYYPSLVRKLSAHRFDAEQYERTIASALDPELVLFDDFLDVVPKPDSFEEQIALELIKRRYVQRKPLIITTELTPNLFEILIPRRGEALFGRVFEMCDGRVYVADQNSENYRTKGLKNETRQESPREKRRRSASALVPVRQRNLARFEGKGAPVPRPEISTVPQRGRSLLSSAGLS